MPTLDWIGKKAVIGHHREVPFHLLKTDEDLSVGEPGSGNLLIEGDNLLALKALLPYYAGKVKCIYIDPPYNTGNENWVYNDAVNSPEMKNWLGKVVGKEAEDLSRHDKWLCMMYPRLSLLHQFLREDGAIFISIDDNELLALRALLNEIFGVRNFIATIIWQKVYSPKNTAKHFSEDHDYIIVFSKNADHWRPHLIPRSEKQDKAYKNPDSDPRGKWKPSGLDARNPYSKGTYSIKCPSGRIIPHPPKGSYWRHSEDKFKELDKDGRIWWGKKGDSIPQLKRFLSEVKQGLVPQTWWPYNEVGHTQEAKQELVDICDFQDSVSVFITPKPVRLIKRILEIATDKDSLILDSFAGSGSTGHAVLEINKSDGGNRRFILVEMEKEICRNVTSQRLRRAIEGYSHDKTDGKRIEVEGLGGGFRFTRLGPTLFDETGAIRSEVSFGDLAAHVYFTETGEPLSCGVRELAPALGPGACSRKSPAGKPAEPKRRQATALQNQAATLQTPMLGVHNGVAVYLLYNGILGDKRANGGNVLTQNVLKTLPPHNGPKVIYGTGCRLGTARLKREGIVFKQIPYAIKVT